MSISVSPSQVEQPSSDFIALETASLEANPAGASDISSAKVSSPINGRAIKVLAQFFGVQFFIQILSLVMGFVLVRRMTAGEYALYTISTSMQATLHIISDSGANSALSARGGLYWQDKRRFGALVNSCLWFRRRISVVGALIVGPILWWMLFSHGAGYGYATTLTVIAVLASSVQLTNGVLIMVPRLCGRFKDLQYADLAGALARLALVITIFLLIPDAIVATAAALVALWVQYWLYKKSVGDSIDVTAGPNDEDKNAIWAAVKQQAANSIYFCIQGQLNIFVISIFGHTRDIADIGALGRLAMFFTVLTAVMNNVVLPRFARSQNAHQARQLYIQVVSLFAGVSLVCLLVAALAPKQVLWLLGPQYAHLEKELLLMIFMNVLFSVAGSIHLLNAARGWLEYSWLYIVIVTGTQIVLLPFLNLSTINGVLWLSIVPQIPAIFPYLWRAHLGFAEMKAREQEVSTAGAV